MKEFFDRLEGFTRKAFHSLKTFRPLGLEVTAKKMLKIVALIGAAWLIIKLLGNFLLVWRICRTVEVIAGLFVG